MKERKTKMTAIELEKTIEEMRIQHVKAYFNDDASNLSREDLLSLYTLMLMKEEIEEREAK
jgi:hypothetical protein